MIPKTPKQKLLNILSLSDLKGLVDQFDLGREVKKAQSRDNLLRDLSRLKRVSVEMVVIGMGLKELKTACRELGLSDAGRERQLVQQILARFGKSGHKLKPIKGDLGSPSRSATGTAIAFHSSEGLGTHA